MQIHALFSMDMIQDWADMFLNSSGWEVFAGLVYLESVCETSR